MTALHWLLLAFVSVPLAELYVLIKVGSVVGVLPTIGLCVLTAALGAVLIRAQGIAALAHAQRSINAGEVPAMALIEGAFILVAGALLLTPGLLTDAVGFGCLIPILRRTIVFEFLKRRFATEIPASNPDRPGRSTHVIEGEFRHEDGSN